MKSATTKFWQNVQGNAPVCSNKNHIFKTAYRQHFFGTLGTHVSTPSAAAIRGRLQKVIPAKESVLKGSPKNNNIQKIPNFQNGEFFGDTL